MNTKAVNNGNVLPMRTWYGITAVVEIRNRFFHRAGFGRVLIPHPPLVNRLLRFGLKDGSYRQLSVLHEFAHFQSLPFIALYTFGFMLLLFVHHKANAFGYIAALAGSHALWELVAELYVRVDNGRRYSAYYKGVSLFPRIIFWTAASAIFLAAWAIL